MARDSGTFNLSSEWDRQGTAARIKMALRRQHRNEESPKIAMRWLGFNFIFEIMWRCMEMQCPGDRDQRKDISSFLIVQSNWQGEALGFMTDTKPDPAALTSRKPVQPGFRISGHDKLTLMPGGSRDAEKPTFQANVGRCVLLTPTSMPVCMEVAVQDSCLSPFVFRSISAIQRRFVSFYYCADVLMHSSLRLWAGAKHWFWPAVLVLQKKSRDLGSFILSYFFMVFSTLRLTKEEVRLASSTVNGNALWLELQGGRGWDDLACGGKLQGWLQGHWSYWSDSLGMKSKQIVQKQTGSSRGSHLLKCFTMLYQFGSN